MEELNLMEAKFKAAHMTCREIWFRSYGTYEGFEEMYNKSLNNVNFSFVRITSNE